jgi:hypothetical protein
MENQVNVGIQRQFYEPFEATDSEAESSDTDASLASDSQVQISIAIQLLSALMLMAKALIQRLLKQLRPTTH